MSFLFPNPEDIKVVTKAARLRSVWLGCVYLPLLMFVSAIWDIFFVMASRILINAGKAAFCVVVAFGTALLLRGYAILSVIGAGYRGELQVGADTRG